MVNRAGQPRWALERAYPAADPRWASARSASSFDAQGAAYFGDLTGNNLKQPLAIMLDDKIISAANIQMHRISRAASSAASPATPRHEFSYLIQHAQRRLAAGAAGR